MTYPVHVPVAPVAEASSATAAAESEAITDPFNDLLHALSAKYATLAQDLTPEVELAEHVLRIITALHALWEMGILEAYSYQAHMLAEQLPAAEQTQLRTLLPAKPDSLSRLPDMHPQVSVVSTDLTCSTLMPDMPQWQHWVQRWARAWVYAWAPRWATIRYRARFQANPRN
jgi:hypothetical protein